MPAYVALPSFPIIPEWTIPFWTRIGLLLGLMVLIAGLEWLIRRDKANRWREYLFFLSVLVVGAVFGILIDQVTSRLSLEYFLYAKSLDPDHIQRELVSLGARAGLTAAAFFGGAFLIANTWGKRTKPLPYRELYAKIGYPILGSILAATLLGVFFHEFVPNHFLGHYEEILLEEERSPFRGVAGAHYGLYLGGVVGTIMGVVQIRRSRSKAGNLDLTGYTPGANRV